MQGWELGPYRIGAELGSGGMGRVFLADRGGETFALKVLHPHLVEAARVADRFAREADIGRRIDHPNVVRTFDVGAAEVDGHTLHYLVTEYVPGRTLRALLDELGRVPEELCRHIAREVAQGLHAIHEAGVVHRDLKPENVLITEDHVVKVMDLGIARLTEASIQLSMTGGFIGSIRYAAPEQFELEEVDHRADWYALGLVLYELVTGEHPAGAGDALETIRRRLEHPPRPAGEVNPQVSPYFEEVLKGLLARHRDHRLDRVPEEDSDWWRDRAAAIRQETHAPLRRARAPRDTEFLGRDSELAELGRHFARAAEGTGRVLLVEGEAGLGKSRLLDEFTGPLDAHVLAGSCAAGAVDGAFLAAIRDGWGEDAPERYLAAAPALAPAFAAFLGGDTPPDGVALDARAFESALVLFCRALAAERPAVVWLDELDLASPRELTLFAALARGLRGHRVLLVGSGRRIDVPGLPAGAARLRLDPLADDAIAALVAPLVDGRATAQRIAERSDGNPFFAIEMARGRPSNSGVAVETPAAVADLVAARLAGLERDERRLLDVASCLGVEFDPVLAGAALDLGAIPTLQAFASIERAQRLVRSAGRDYRFDHRLLREALYQALPDALREEYHALLGDAIERNRPVEGLRAVEAARQFLAARRVGRARPHLEPAFAHLERALRWPEATRLGEAALAQLEGDERFDLLLRQANWLDGAGERAAQGRAAERAVEEAGEDPGRAARAQYALGTWLWRHSRLDDARAAFTEARDRAREAGDRKTESDAIGGIGRVHLSSGALAESLACAQERLAQVEELGDLRRRAHTHNDLGNVMHALARWDECAEHYRTAARLAKEAGLPRLEASANANLALPLRAQGHMEEARRTHEADVRFMREHGDRLGEASAIANLGLIDLLQSRYEASIPRFERSLELALELGDREVEGVALSNLGMARMWLGRLADALETHERTLALTRAIGNREYEASDLKSLAQANQFLGRLPEARRMLEESLRISREIGADYATVYALADLAEVARAEGDRDQGRDLHRQQHEMAEKVGDRPHAAHALAALGVDACERGNEDEGRALFERARAVADELDLPELKMICAAWLAGLPGGDVAEAERLWQECGARAGFIFQMHALLRLYRVTGKRAYLEAAHDQLEDVRAHAPEQDRDSMVRNLELYREIAEAYAAAR